MGDTLALAKTVVSFLLPERLFVLILVVGVVGLWAGRIGFGRRMVTLAAVGLAVIGPLPFGALLLKPLEDSFPPDPAVGSPSAIIVLSGGELGAISAHTDQITLSDGADRFTTALMLARRFPGARVLYVGQSVRLPGGALLPQAYFERSGLDPARLDIEPLSRNTWENAEFSLEMAPPEGPYLLVTSAYHMRRAVGMFCKAGWRDLVPWPVDYRTAGWGHVRWQPGYNTGLLDTAVRERLALLVYRVRGQLAGRETLGTCLAKSETRTGGKADPG